jgi:RNA polymerase sigma factor (TIGR02999 family)
MSDPDVTTLLQDWGRGDSKALEKLVPLVLGELRRVARGYFVGERPGHTLEPTALVNEVFMWLMEREQVQWQSRTQFFGFAAQLMRRILVDYARSHGREKRGAGVAVQPLDEALTLAATRDVDVVALDDALKELEKIDPDGSRVVEMSFFAGLTQDEIAEVMRVSKMTVRRRWTAARLWLYRELKRD